MLDVNLSYKILISFQIRAKITKCSVECSTGIQIATQTECNMGSFTSSDPSAWFLKNGNAASLDCTPPPPTEEPTAPPSNVCDQSKLPPAPAGGSWKCVLQLKWNQWRCGYVCDNDPSANFLKADLRAFCKLNKNKWFVKGDAGTC